MIAITGNTYPVKEQLKAIGAKWNPDQKVWMVSEDKAEQARQIVNGAGPKHPYTGGKSTYRTAKRGTWTGCRCGSVEEYERPGDCASCRFDR